MAIAGSGLYGPTLEKIFIDTAAESLEAEDHKCLLVTDTYTPNYDTHAVRTDVTNEIGAGGGYSTGGDTINATEVTFTGGVLTYDHDDPQWATSTISNAMAGIDYLNVGTAGTDLLLCLMDFVTAVSTTNGLLLISINASGVFTLDYVP